MSKRVEITVEKPESPEQKDTRKASRIDLNGICAHLACRWFSYKECFHCHRVEHDCECKDEKQDLRVVFFIHERSDTVGNETTGLRFNRKNDMAEAMVQYYAASAAWPDISLVRWAGARGIRILTTMSEEKRKEIQARKAELEAMKEASAAGEMVNVEAGVAPMTEVSL